jgi:hypothetical protein
MAGAKDTVFRLESWQWGGGKISKEREGPVGRRRKDGWPSAELAGEASGGRSISKYEIKIYETETENCFEWVWT